MPSPHDESKEYTVSVSTDDIRAAIRLTASALYTFAEEALAAHDDQEVDECQFNAFARDILGVLTQHAEELSEGEGSWGAPEGEKLPYA